MKRKVYVKPQITELRYCEKKGFFTSEIDSGSSSHAKSKETDPAKLLKKALWQAGVRYKRPKTLLPGNPVITLKKDKLVIFVDNAIWHGYDWENRKHTIKTDSEYWIARIERIIQYDQEINTYYKSKGWSVLRFWDFEVNEELSKCLSSVVKTNAN